MEPGQLQTVLALYTDRKSSRLALSSSQIRKGKAVGEEVPCGYGPQIEVWI